MTVKFGRVQIRVKQTTATRHPSALRKKTNKAPKVRPSLQPGTVAILLAGPYAGRRVVVLKALESGFMAVTGPYALNRVPVRRAHQKFMIATSTKIDVSRVEMSKLTDEYFKKEAKRTEAGDITEQTSASPMKAHRSQAMKDDQKALDASLLVEIRKTPLLDQYLKTRFSLTSTFGLKAHELKF